MEKNRLDFIDFTRGLAALAVLLSHAGADAGYFTKFGFGYHWLNLGQVGIIAFFAVSGFVIPLSLEHSKSMLSFGIRRVFRIYPLFLAMLCVAIFLQTIGIGYPTAVDQSIARTILANLAFIADYTRYPNLVGGSWTLSIEVVWYVCFALAFVLGLHRKPLLLATVVSGSFVCIACVSMAFQTRLPLGRLGMLGACLVGYFFYQSYAGQSEKKTSRICIGMLLTSIFLLLWTSFSYYQADGTTFQCVVISWTTGFLLFLVPFIRREDDFIRLAAFRMLGRYSYSIYLVHPLVIFGCLHAFERPAIQLTCMIVLSLAIAVVTFNLVEAPGIWAGKTLDRFLSSRKSSRHRESMV